VSSAADSQPIERLIRLHTATDPASTVALLWQGPGDPMMNVRPGVAERAFRLPTGTASLRLIFDQPRAVRAQAWGEAAAQALDLAPALVGELDDPEPLTPQHDIVRDLQRRLPGLRLTSGAPIVDTLLFSILGQKVTSLEARRSYRALIRLHGEPAPGPLGLRLAPAPAKLARMPYWVFHPMNLERRRADTIRAAAAAAPWLARLGDVAAGDRLRRLQTLPGVGPWTAAEAARLAFGDADAVSVGDFHIPRLVCRALAGEANGDDARMLELLEPYRGQRARVVLLLEHGGAYLPRRAPRMAPRSIAAM